MPMTNSLIKYLKNYATRNKNAIKPGKDKSMAEVITMLLGEGIKLFNEGLPEQRLELISSKQYDKGLIQLHYKREDQ